MTAMPFLRRGVLVAGLAACGRHTPLEPSGPAKLIVIAPIDSIDLGAVDTLQVVAEDASGHALATPAVTWRSSDSTVASVSARGIVTAQAVGSATISASTAMLTGSAVIRVREQFGVGILFGAALNEILLVAPGQAAQLTAFEYSTHTYLTRKPAQITWSSSDASLATVSATGLVTGVAPGMVTITANVDQHPTTQQVHVQNSPGTATIRMINASDAVPSVTMHPNSGSPVTLPYAAMSEETIAAGSLQMSLDGVSATYSRDYYNPLFFGLSVFYGLVPVGAHQTFVAVDSYSPVVIAWLSDRTDPVPPDSAVVRAMLAVGVSGYNVYFTSTGAPMGVLALQGCYLDWPFGYTSYAGRAAGNFDIVLQGGKGLDGPEVARFHVTPSAGHAMTYIITGKDAASLKLIPVVDK
jgi:hypothetical protein